MLLTIDLPDRTCTQAAVLQRWRAATEDAALENFAGTFESNLSGQLILSPPPTLLHRDCQSKIYQWLLRLMGPSPQFETPIATADGVRCVDVAWFSPQRLAEVIDQPASPIAPEICVELLSPCNRASEMAIKRRLYFDAGAAECWQCDMDRQMTFYFPAAPDTAHTNSNRCPDFPTRIAA